MSNETEIEPALTAGQWAAIGRDRKNGEAPASQIRFSFGNGPFNPFGPFALMAVANAALPDGDPRKFTPDDLDTLTAAESSIEQEWGATETGSAIAKLRRKLAALLPPHP